MARLGDGRLLVALLLALTGCSSAPPGSQETAQLNGTSSTFAWNAVAMFAMISSSASFPAATSRAIWLRIDSAAEARDT